MNLRSDLHLGETLLAGALLGLLIGGAWDTGLPVRPLWLLPAVLVGLAAHRAGRVTAAWAVSAWGATSLAMVVLGDQLAFHALTGAGTSLALVPLGVWERRTRCGRRPLGSLAWVAVLGALSGAASERGLRAVFELTAEGTRLAFLGTVPLAVTTAAAVVLASWPGRAAALGVALEARAVRLARDVRGELRSVVRALLQEYRACRSLAQRPHERRALETAVAELLDLSADWACVERAMGGDATLGADELTEAFAQRKRHSATRLFARTPDEDPSTRVHQAALEAAEDETRALLEENALQRERLLIRLRGGVAEMRRARLRALRASAEQIAARGPMASAAVAAFTRLDR